MAKTTEGFGPLGGPFPKPDRFMEAVLYVMTGIMLVVVVLSVLDLFGYGPGWWGHL